MQKDRAQSWMHAGGSEVHTEHATRHTSHTHTQRRNIQCKAKSTLTSCSTLPLVSLQNVLQTREITFART